MIKLKQVAFEQKRKNFKPEDDEIKYSIRGEDFDTDFLFFRRKSLLNEAGPTFHRHFKAGEILYMTRNPRLRKVAQANFEGVAANTTLILDEMENEFLIPGILKFVLSSERFHLYAKSVQVGSTNPFTKWKDLQEFTFTPPSLVRQKALVEILKKIEQSLKELQGLVKSLGVLDKVISYDFFKTRSSHSMRIADLLDGRPESGYSPVKHWEDTDNYVLTLSCLKKSGYIESKLKPITDDDYEKGKKLTDGDFLISRANTMDLVGLCGIYKETDDTTIFPDTMWRLRFKEAQSPELIMNYLLSPQGRKSIQMLAAGTSGSMKKINKASFSSVMVPQVDEELGDKYCETIKYLRTSYRNERLKEEKLISMRKKIVEELVG